jgi:hypothetical protein
MADHPFLVKNRPGKNTADPWVVALARITGSTVITEEVVDQIAKYPKIPWVCREYRVPWVRLLDVIRTEWTRARAAENRKKKPKPVPNNDYYERYELTLAPIEPWKQLPAEEYRHKIREMAEEIEEEARIARRGRKPLGAKAVTRIPLNHKTELPPQPWFEDRRRMVCWSDPRSPETKAYLDRYWDFQRTFRCASEQLLAGKLDVEFPPGAFRPVTRTEAATPT